MSLHVVIFDGTLKQEGENTPSFCVPEARPSADEYRGCVLEIADSPLFGVIAMSNPKPLNEEDTTCGVAPIRAGAKCIDLWGQLSVEIRLCCTVAALIGLSGIDVVA